MPPSSIPFIISFLLLLLLLTPISPQPHPDLQPLLSFKATIPHPPTPLSNWNNSSTSPCNFYGISCSNNRVFRIVLERLNLNGLITPLISLSSLRVLSLKYNNFSGTLPDFSTLSSLRLLFLSHNLFQGHLGNFVFVHYGIYRLDLSHNNLTGDIPQYFSKLTHLLTLRLEENGFSGRVPSGLNAKRLQDFNVSRNKLEGEIPFSLKGFPVSAFVGNVGLCGLPLKNCSGFSGFSSDPDKPGSGHGAIGGPNSISSSPNSDGSNVVMKRRGDKGGGISTLAIVAIIVGDVLVLGVVSLLLYCCLCQSCGNNKESKSLSHLHEGEKIVYSSSPYRGGVGGGGNQSGFERGKMVFFEGAKRFELEDLLRASAEMLGKGGFGTAYKAVLDDGNVVAVKRLKDFSVNGRREFEQHMEVLGRLRHPNLVSLKAYYFARDEKLMVYDYMPNGNLYWLLHGNRGPGRTPLDWNTRLKIAAGAGLGVASIHNSCQSLKLTHGNIKSTNVLIDNSGNARVSDFGLSAFASPSSTPRSNGYWAPEVALDDRKLTQKSDVYSFGVLLLELLTGKCPSVVDNGGPGKGYGGMVDLPRWVQSVVREEWTAEVFDLELMRYKDIEEEMVGLLQIALACTSASPDQRPKINYVVKMIEELRGVEVSPSHTHDSVSDSPSVSEDTGAVSQ
ncbi:hypothetical protein Leryth_026601 [Lithospermum erythrorhizon]|nr:hypothetical protein Leryth_026601 [Lithospermum erythrorhizon]